MFEQRNGDDDDDDDILTNLILVEIAYTYTKLKWWFLDFAQIVGHCSQNNTTYINITKNTKYSTVHTAKSALPVKCV